MSMKTVAIDYAAHSDTVCSLRLFINGSTNTVRVCRRTPHQCVDSDRSNLAKIRKYAEFWVSIGMAQVCVGLFRLAHLF